ncbi:LysR family transcriptional regulator [Telmatospirillum sp. J64-1]|uniref:LysR family transcriptional regulator n=1 Tax=Telmatospirillum sp. J64-1 TaxID=2502183 RepID=UPI00115CFEE1|nr:LysR family transcriptional regulator [Telmatospirillum sp. J64-1]
MSQNTPVQVAFGRLLGRGIKLRHLSLIVALEETGSVSSAAARLNMTQPAASRLLAELETIIRVKLYDRHPRGIRLNAYGRVLAERAARMLRDLDQVGREIEEMGAGQRGTVAIGSVSGPALEIVLPVIRQSRIAHPDIQINVTVDVTDRLTDELLAGKLDFYLGRIPAAIDPRSFTARVVGEEPLSLVVREDHPLTRRASITLEDCIGYDWILQAIGGLLRSTVESYLVQKGYPLPDRVLSTSSLLLTLALVGSTNSIAAISTAAARFYSDPSRLGGRVVTLPVAPDLRVTAYSLIRLRDQPLSPAAQTLYGMINERLDLVLDQEKE